MTATQPLRRRTVRLAGVLAAMALAGLTAAPASADRTNSYVALGDSYAAGQGAAPYVDAACLRSEHGYPTLLDAVRKIRLAGNTACSGATTSSVRAVQIPAMSKNADLVTVTAGGNDLDSIGALGICTVDPGQACFTALQQRAAVLQTALTDPAASPFFQDLLAMLNEVKAKAPRADIYVTGYPLLFEPGASPAAGPINGLTQQLNAVIAKAAQAADGGRSKVIYVDVTRAFAGHGIGSAQPWIVGLPASLETFHPTADGYAKGYAASIRAALN
ncbi:SGNH/GDSL hydrolase family protein [Arthrobacter globiformis]|uniref:SGNH/GDSL hydrolase family protein n=1 Tax=Arthrobacter globiformis TaxID=1665 RepID=A0A328HJH5_ARTGO|nr:SGNH/GDSL hydrolase family protein [Arthrobacter globiformis]RAM38766.1 SGNH/GDSL hydrolase family protein [Arthrobacter globiformis]